MIKLHTYIVCCGFFSYFLSGVNFKKQNQTNFLEIKTHCFGETNNVFITKNINILIDYEFFFEFFFFGFGWICWFSKLQKTQCVDNDSLGMLNHGFVLFFLEKNANYFVWFFYLQFHRVLFFEKSIKSFNFFSYLRKKIIPLII
jgi:hypothetical protein